MKFDPKTLNFPFYPGDKLYAVNVDALELVESEIAAVFIDKDSIKIVEDVSLDHSGDYSEPFEPGELNCYLTREEAEKSLAEYSKGYPIYDFWPEKTDWLYTTRYLPPEGKYINADRGPVCVYRGGQFYDTNGNATEVKSWKPVHSGDE